VAGIYTLHTPIFIRYSNCSNELLLLGSVYDVTLQMKYCLHDFVICN
jgi:hypothetical protein